VQTVTGIITLVQEDRFQLAREDGRKELFLLGRWARQNGGDLHRLAHEGRPVTVRYSRAPGLIAETAHHIALVDHAQLPPREMP
jgi:hypothetical protein